MGFDGYVAIVTGASSGIGFAVAEQLVAAGARVALVARSKEGLDLAVSRLGPERAVSFPLDVTDRVAITALPAAVQAHFGRLDLVVNDAGASHRGPVIERSAEDLGAILETNLVAPVLLTRAALPLLPRGGAVVTVASLAGKVPVPDEATYSASKAGIRAFSRALRAELRERGIAVATVCPGPVDTGFFGDVSTVPDLVFSQPMSTASDVAAAVLRALAGEAPEIDVPVLSGKLATLGYLSPEVFARLRPMMERRGARNKARYLARRRAK